MSNYLTNDQLEVPRDVTPKCMIPMTDNFRAEKLLIGHNVAFDRAFVEEAYELQVS